MQTPTTKTITIPSVLAIRKRIARAETLLALFALENPEIDPDDITRLQDDLSALGEWASHLPQIVGVVKSAGISLPNYVSSEH